MQTDKMKVLLYLKKERIGQVGASSDYGADNLRANDSSIQLQTVVRPQAVECS